MSSVILMSEERLRKTVLNAHKAIKENQSVFTRKALEALDKDTEAPSIIDVPPRQVGAMDQSVGSEPTNQEIVALSKKVHGKLLKKLRSKERRRRAELGEEFLLDELELLRTVPQFAPLANVLEFLIGRSVKQANLESLERRALTKLIEVLETEG